MLADEAWRLGCFNQDDADIWRAMLASQRRFVEFQRRHAARLGGHFYITLMPRTLDLLECCLTFLPPHLTVILILNGLDAWEEDFVNRRYAALPRFKLDMPATGSVGYGHVLDMLAEGNETDYGVLDQDCFTLENEIFDRLRPGRKDFAIAPFVTLNVLARMRFPRTYFLYFNLANIKRIRERHRLSFRMCRRIPPHIETALAAIGFGYHNFPHPSLGYFDDFQLIWAMGLHDGLTYRRPAKRGLLDRRRPRLAHFEAGSLYLDRDALLRMAETFGNYDSLSLLGKEKFRAAAITHYAHLRLLESLASEEIRQGYLPNYGVYPDSATILGTYGSLIPATKVAEVETVVREARKRAAAAV